MGGINIDNIESGLVRPAGGIDLPAPQLANIRFIHNLALDRIIA